MSNQSSLLNSFTGKRNNKVANINFDTKTLTAGQWVTLGKLDVTPIFSQKSFALITTGAGNAAIVNISDGSNLQIYAPVSGAYGGSATFLCT